MFYSTFLIFSLFFSINSFCEVEDGDEEAVKIRDKDDCIKRSLSDEEVENGGYKCCYIKEEVDTISFDGKLYSCILVNQTGYENIKDLVKQKERETGVDNVKIDCQSSYLYYGILIISLLIL